MTPSLTSRSLRAATAAAVGLFGLAGVTPLHAATEFSVTNLVSNGAVAAHTTDTSLVNPWGLAASPTGPFWVGDNGTGVSTLYNSSGTKIPLTVTIPPPSGGTPPSAPTGVVFNGTGGFKQGSGGATPLFIFDSENGTISSWAPANGTSAVLAKDESTLGAGAVYKGLAIGSSGGGSFLYATDFTNGAVEQFDTNLNLVRAFTDPSVAAGYAPFGIQALDGHLFVTYALRSGIDDVPGAGNGYVDEFNFDGTFVKQLVGQGGQVNSPWGLDIAPSSFGEFAGDLLVGNFGDGTISVFDPSTGDFLGKLLGTDGNPLFIDGLWSLMNGNGGAGGHLGTVYFTAGLNDEQDGLFGSIASVPEPSTWAMMLLGFGAIGLMTRRRRREERLAQLA